MKEVIKQVKNKEETGAKKAMEHLIPYGMYTEKSLQDIMDTCALYGREDILSMILQIGKITPFIINYLYTLAIDKQLTNVIRDVKENERIKHFARIDPDIAVYDAKIYGIADPK